MAATTAPAAATTAASVATPPPGIRFHDGEPFDAAAVKANLDDLRKAVTAAMLRPVTSVDVVDTNAVKVTLSEKSVNFPASLVNQQRAMVAPAKI